MIHVVQSFLAFHCTMMVESTIRRVIGVTPLWHPVRYEMTAVWKHLKHLSVVIGFFSVRDDTTELINWKHAQKVINFKLTY